jgi:hypothetical protein
MDCRKEVGWFSDRNRDKYGRTLTERKRHHSFWVSSRYSVISDAVHICTETSSIALGTSCANSDSGALLQFGHRPMAVLYP